MEALSLMINKACLQGSIDTGIRVAHALHITHLLFVDDVLLFGAGTKDKWLHYRRILNVLCDATGLRINVNKSYFTRQCDDDNICSFISGLFPFAQYGLEDGIRYLGFSIKPSSYGVSDWNWLWFRRYQGG